jgi:hypothetical protein
VLEVRHPSPSVINRKDDYFSPATRRFIEILKATAKEIAKES